MARKIESKETRTIFNLGKPMENSSIFNFNNSISSYIKNEAKIESKNEMKTGYGDKVKINDENETRIDNDIDRFKKVFPYLGTKFLRHKIKALTSENKALTSENKINSSDDAWFCTQCTYANPSLLLSCNMCQIQRSQDTQEEVKWLCKNCKNSNVTVEPHLCDYCHNPMLSPLADQYEMVGLEELKNKTIILYFGAIWEENFNLLTNNLITWYTKFRNVSDVNDKDNKSRDDKDNKSKDDKDNKSKDDKDNKSRDDKSKNAKENKDDESKGNKDDKNKNDKDDKNKNNKEIASDTNHDQSIEVIYVSDDNSMRQFDAAFKTMPWLAIPWNPNQGSETKNTFKKFKFSNIPWVTVISPDGRIINKDASEKIKDGNMEYPWKKNLLKHILSGEDNNDMEKNEAQLRLGKLCIGLLVGYFSSKVCQDYVKDLVLPLWKRVNSLEPPPTSAKHIVNMVKTVSTMVHLSPLIQSSSASTLTEISSHESKAQTSSHELLNIMCVPIDSSEKDFDYVKSLPFQYLAFGDKRIELFRDKHINDAYPTLLILNSSTGEILTRQSLNNMNTTCSCSPPCFPPQSISFPPTLVTSSSSSLLSSSSSLAPQSLYSSPSLSSSLSSPPSLTSSLSSLPSSSLLPPSLSLWPFAEAAKINESKEMKQMNLPTISERPLELSLTSASLLNVMPVILYVYDLNSSHAPIENKCAPVIESKYGMVIENKYEPSTENKCAPIIESKCAPTYTDHLEILALFEEMRLSGAPIKAIIANLKIAIHLLNHISFVSGVECTKPGFYIINARENLFCQPKTEINGGISFAPGEIKVKLRKFINDFIRRNYSEMIVDKISSRL